MKKEEALKEESMRAYAARISQANRTELTVIVYDILIEEAEEGLSCLEKGRKEAALPHLEKARAFLMELLGTLDFQYALGRQLFLLYAFMNKVFLTAIRKREPGDLEEVLGMLSQLRESFAAAAKSDHSPPLMGNTQKIYAGLTYGRNSLNEVCIDDGKGSRGYRV